MPGAAHASAEGPPAPGGDASAVPGAEAGPRLRVVGTEDVYPNWDAIYRDNIDRIYRLMYAKVGNRADAEDLTAEVFLTALRPLRVSASVGEVRAYLLAVARTTLAAHWRRTLGIVVTTLDGEQLEAAAGQSRETTPDAGGGSSTAGPADGQAPQAETILAGLSPRDERILRLRFLESRSIREAAAELGVTVANAKVLQHRALRRAAELTRRREA
ncbi:RNA polymerase sigma factor [Frankia canadensis]|nr:RNA polymerase sigma factor [Frankia canadensis]